jgi:hypothetical protein
MSKFGLYPTDLKISCSNFQCYNRAEFFLGKEDAPTGTTTIICGQCADELKAQLSPVTVIDGGVIVTDTIKASEITVSEIVTEEPKKAPAKKKAAK